MKPKPLEFAQIPETARFLEVLDKLIAMQIVDSDADFCRRTGYAPQSLSQIRKQKRNVTVELISKLYSIFDGASLVYIFSGTGPLVLEASEVTLAAEPGAGYGEGAKKLAAYNVRLERIVEAQIENAKVNIKYVKSLESQIDELKKELAAQIRK